LPDTGLVVSCTARRSWWWYNRLVIGIAAGGGIAMLVGAATAHDTASIPLLVIGGWWLLGGLLAIWQVRQQVHEIVIHGDSVEFRSTAKRVTIPAVEIVEVGSSRRGGYLRFRTRSNGVIKVAPRLHGLFDFLIELRRLNPQVKVGTL